MKIELGKNKELDLDLNRVTSIMLVGKCGTGKSRITKEILRKAKEGYSKLDVLYVDYHAADYNDVMGIVGDLLNEKHLLTEPELKSLHDVVMEQQKLRNQFICDEGVTTLDELIDKEVTTFVIGGREYMPDDIVWYYEDGQLSIMKREWWKVIFISVINEVVVNIIQQDYSCVLMSFTRLICQKKVRS